MEVTLKHYKGPPLGSNLINDFTLVSEDSKKRVALVVDCETIGYINACNVDQFLSLFDTLTVQH